MKKFLVLIGSSIIFLTGKAFAQSTVKTDLGDVSNIGQYVSLLIARLIPIASALAVLMMIYAGYLYMTSQGNENQISTAKEIIIGVISGILLLFTVGLILRQVIGTLS